MLRILWTKHRLLVLGFSAAMLIATVLLVRLTFGFVYWSNHRDVEIAGWMTLGYIANSYDVELKLVLSAVSLDAPPRKRTTLGELAKMQGVSGQALQQSILETVNAERDKE